MTTQGFFGGLLLTCGWLGAVFSGGCSLLLAFSPSDYIDFSIILLFGGIPFVGFVLMIFVGKAMLKKPS